MRNNEKEELWMALVGLKSSMESDNREQLLP
jgi:hypothetical protein